MAAHKEILTIERDITCRKWLTTKMLRNQPIKL
jgi:hypothetical protein